MAESPLIDRFEDVIDWVTTGYPPPESATPPASPDKREGPTTPRPDRQLPPLFGALPSSPVSLPQQPSAGANDEEDRTLTPRTAAARRINTASSPVTPGGTKKAPKPRFQVVLPKVASPPLSSFGADAFECNGEIISPGPVFLKLEDGQLHARREDFEELAEEGQGCHGRVTKVRHRETHTIMAMKAIDLATPSSEQSGRIVRELNILRSASPCSAIINYYGAFYDNHTGVIHIAMEYMDAGSLDKLLKREKVQAQGGVPEVFVGKIAYASIRGLLYLKKELNVIHRDIKPSNILLNYQGDIKLCDFSVSGELVQSRAGTYTGTMYYMAPERINPEIDKEYNVLADVWSLGVTLVELATGKYPYPKPEKTNPYFMLQQIVKGDSPASLLSAERFSEDFRGFMFQCLEKDPLKRPSFQQLLDHPFVSRCKADPQDFGAYLRSVGDSAPSV